MIDDKYREQFGFRLTETSFGKIVDYLHAPKDASSLAVTRILFGLAMLFDIPDERGGSMLVRRWGGTTCHFPLIPLLTALPMPYMALVYAAMWLGALGIMLGYKYRLSSSMFAICYWYIFLIEKSFWNNHSYLFGLVSLLLACTQANCCWSIDAYLDPTKKKDTVPYWNYFILKYQFFILYFMAGLKKGTAEWLTGYSVLNLSQHWVFDPFKLFLTVSQIDYLIVHCFIFVFDLTIAIWMMWSRTRPVAMIFCALFHLMNSRLFRIGMFPWVCLATMPLFYPFDWPKSLGKYLNYEYKQFKNSIYYYFTSSSLYNIIWPNQEQEGDINEGNEESNLVYHEHEQQQNEENVMRENLYRLKESENRQNEENMRDTDTETSYEETNETHGTNSRLQKILTTCLIFVYVCLQAFLPYSHFLTKGYNNWTEGLYGYSWDMMVHTWDTQSVVVKIVDKETKKEYFIDPGVYAPNERWSRHGDMVYQYAHCLKDTLLKERKKFKGISGNISVYVDVWCSMNGRFTQRLFDSNFDILEASWSPFKEIPYLMPLLDEALHWRTYLLEITEDVQKRRTGANVLFFADFPGYTHEKYIPSDLKDVTFAVIAGNVSYEPQGTDLLPSACYKLTEGKVITIGSGNFHKINNIGETPAYYMYIFTNASQTDTPYQEAVKPKLPIASELNARFKGMKKFLQTILFSIYQMILKCDACLSN